LNPAESHITFDAGWTFLGLPKYPAIPNVKQGGTVALDLLVNAATGQKVVDYRTCGGTARWTFNASRATFN
jgi:hypothetical protein